MATRSTNVEKVREVIRLISLDFSINKISKQVGISRTSVRFIKSAVSNSGLTAGNIIVLDDSQIREIVYPSKDNLSPRFQKLEPLIPNIFKSLSRKHENLLHQWELYIKGHPEKPSLGGAFRYITI